VFEIAERNAYLVDHAVPGVACVVDDDVDLAVAEVCGLLDERVDVCVVEHVSRDSESLAAILVDGVCDTLCFFCGVVLALRLRTPYICPIPRCIWLHGPQYAHYRKEVETNRRRYRSRQL
jgi:hypothetical protein